MNELINSSSPYLRAHAQNPVNWRTYSKEAFTLAKERDVPVFISSGYFACHWCHVMARESFEDLETARFLNENFISIKVDREELPGVDTYLMRACLLLNGSGGWPLSIFATPEGKIFFAGTYFPKDRRLGMPAFMDILKQLKNAWDSDRAQIYGLADHLTETLDSMSNDNLLSDEKEAFLNASASFETRLASLGFSVTFCETLVSSFNKSIDKVNGSFLGAPKFPRFISHELLILLCAITKDENLGEICKASLDSLASSALCDQLAGGFHRYCIDREFKVPHFEKMLDDQVYAINTYLLAYRVFREPRYLYTLSKTIDFVLKNMKKDKGGFISALSAEAGSQEGEPYLWSKEEVEGKLSAQEQLKFREIFNFNNYILENGKSIIFMGRENYRRERYREAEDLINKLLLIRNSKTQPERDSKVLLDYNSELLRALLNAGFYLNRSDLISEVESNLNFIENNFRRGDDKFCHSWLDEPGWAPASLRDLSALGLVYLQYGLFSSSQEYLSKAYQLTKSIERGFIRDGRIYDYIDDVLGLKIADLGDEPCRSGVSLFAELCYMLGTAIGDNELLGLGIRLVNSFSEEVSQHPLNFVSSASLAIKFAKGLAVISLDDVSDDFIELVRNTYLPFTLIDPKNILKQGEGLEKDRAKAYICLEGVCNLPTSDLAVFDFQLHSLLDAQ